MSKGILLHVPEILVLDAMGVLYQAGDDVAELPVVLVDD